MSCSTRGKGKSVGGLFRGEIFVLRIGAKVSLYFLRAGAFSVGGGLAGLPQKMVAALVSEIPQAAAFAGGVSFQFISHMGGGGQTGVRSPGCGKLQHMHVVIVAVYCTMFVNHGTARVRSLCHYRNAGPGGHEDALPNSPRSSAAS